MIRNRLSDFLNRPNVTVVRDEWHMRSVALAGTPLTVALAQASPEEPLQPTATQRGPAIHPEDAYRFCDVYDAHHGHPTATPLQQEYFDPGSMELHRLAELRHVNGIKMPGDLGYWVGYRIVTSYFQHATGKHEALRDIREISDDGQEVQTARPRRADSRNRPAGPPVEL